MFVAQCCGFVLATDFMSVRAVAKVTSFCAFNIRIALLSRYFLLLVTWFNPR